MLKQKNKLVNNVDNFYNGREKIIEGFKNGVFPVYYGNHIGLVKMKMMMKKMKKMSENNKKNKKNKNQ